MKNTNQSTWSRISNSITFKAVTIGVLILLMLIPVNMIRQLILEREYTSESVVSDISSKWGDKQTLTGPIIAVPYKYYTSNNKEAYNYAYFLPEDLNIVVDMEPEIRYRSIYKVVVYQSKIKVKGSFTHPDLDKLNTSASFIDWDNAFVYIGISDMRGIRNDITFKWNGDKAEVTPGISGSHVIQSGVTIKAPFQHQNKEAAYAFEFDLTLNGSHGLFFVPVGKTTKVAVNSSWKSPSFDGAFLPDSREITASGFNAQWSIYNYNRNFPQMWIGDAYHVGSSEFGTNLLLPVDHYQKAMRSVKYAIIFIALTFLVFFLVELISRKRIHPLQYLLVSIGLVLFYSLLLAFSEQMNFNLAYLFSASAIILLITAYSHSIFRQIRQTALMGAFLILLYLFLYTVLQLEDMALLIGSIGLFIALSVVMYISRKVNWYQQEELAGSED